MRPIINRLPTFGTTGWLAPAVALLVYAVAMLWALDQFPIYFFTDEAMNVLLAEELVARGFRDREGAPLPVYFEFAPQRWMAVLSVYVHALPVALLGKSIFVARATQATISLLGAVAVALILKTAFQAKVWWAALLLMAAAPAWFLHARTAFETVMMASFYACFLLGYLQYRLRSPRYLLPTVGFGAAAFYTYSSGQASMLVLAVGLLLSDLRYHLRHWRSGLLALMLAGVLALPLLGFRLDHPAAMETSLRVVDSRWYRNLTFEEKLSDAARAYLTALGPEYWFFRQQGTLVRHRMNDDPHIHTAVLPLFLLGLGVCLFRLRSAPHRAVLLATLAAPAAVVLVDVAITRVIAFVVPATVLAGVGLELLVRLGARRVPRPLIGAAILTVLSVGTLSMLREALTEGPLWFRDYGLYGMQYGAKQLFQEAIPELLHQDPRARVFVSPNWANGTDAFPRFFLTPAQRSRVHLRSGDAYLEGKLDLRPDDVIVMTAAEFERARLSPKLRTVDVQGVVPYPDGRPGFYFTRLAYAADVDALFESERRARLQPVEGEVDVEGRRVRIRYSRLGAGQPRDLFDGDRFTLVRGLEANPLVIELFFVEPRVIAGLGADLGTMDYTLTAHVTTRRADESRSYEVTGRNVSADPHVELPFDGGPHEASALRVEIRDLRRQGEAQIHVRELTLR